MQIAGPPFPSVPLPTGPVANPPLDQAPSPDSEFSEFYSPTPPEFHVSTPPYSPTSPPYSPASQQ